MTKTIIKTLSAVLGSLIIPTIVLASSSLVVRIETPKTPVSQSEFKVNFVALDMNNNEVTVKCYKQSPSDAAFVQFDTDKLLKAGGNSGSCQVNSSVITDNGSYKFKVIATSNLTVESNVVTVDYNTSTPGTPNSYSKEKVGSCQYTIKFRTDNDGGKTTRVTLYRADTTSFIADAPSQVDSRAVGSNTAVEITNTVPDCNKTYYYAVRAFSDSGLGSGVIGDENIIVTSSTTTTSSSTTPSTQTTGGSTTTAIPVVTSSVTPEGVAPEEAEGQEVTVSPEANPEILGAQTVEPFWKTNFFRLGIIIVLVGLFIALRKKN